MPDQPPIRVVLADDHGVLRAGLKALVDLEPDMTIVGQASDGAEAVAAVRRERPDGVVTDLSMPVLDGLPVKILVLTAEAQEDYLFKVLEADGAGFVRTQSADTYRQWIMEKLDLHHRSELIRYALEKGLLRAP